MFPLRCNPQTGFIRSAQTNEVTSRLKLLLSYYFSNLIIIKYIYILKNIFFFIYIFFSSSTLRVEIINMTTITLGTNMLNAQGQWFLVIYIAG